EAASDFGFLGNEHEDHAVLLEKSVTVGEGENAAVLQFFKDRLEVALFRRADEQEVTSLDLIDVFKKSDDKLPALDRPAPKIILQGVAKRIFAQNAHHKLLVIGRQDLFRPDRVLRDVMDELDFGGGFIGGLRATGVADPRQDCQK